MEQRILMLQNARKEFDPGQAVYTVNLSIQITVYIQLQQTLKNIGFGGIFELLSSVICLSAVICCHDISFII